MIRLKSTWALWTGWEWLRLHVVLLGVEVKTSIDFGLRILDFYWVHNVHPVHRSIRSILHPVHKAQVNLSLIISADKLHLVL